MELESWKPAILKYLDSFSGMQAVCGLGVPGARGEALASAFRSWAAEGGWEVVDLSNPSDAVRRFDTVPGALRDGRPLVLIVGAEHSTPLALFLRTATERMPQWTWGAERVAPKAAQRVIVVVPGARGKDEVSADHQAVPYWEFLPTAS